MMSPSTKAVPAAMHRGDARDSCSNACARRNAKRRTAPGGILLTGGTGFLGRELVARLLARDGDETIYLLIRGRSKADVRRRFLALSDYLRLRFPALDLKRIRPLGGDVTLPGFGLDRETMQYLACRITRIVHAAASINLNASLENARKTNLGGAGEILRLALYCRSLQSLAWISTAFVAGDRTGRILETELQHGQKFRNAYEQSKFEAEFLARSFKALLPVIIFRPSIIVGDSRDGYTCNFSSIYRPLRLVAEGALRRVPGRPETMLDCVPVDYVADTVVELADRSGSVGNCYQLVAGRGGTITARELLERAVRYFHTGGEPLRFVSSRVQTDARLRVFFDYLDDRKQFDGSATRAALHGTGLECPRITDYLDRLFEFCERTDWGGHGATGQSTFISCRHSPGKEWRYAE